MSLDRVKGAVTLVFAFTFFGWALLHSVLGWCTRWGCGRSPIGMWVASLGSWGELLVTGVEEIRIVLAVVAISAVVISVVKAKVGALADRF
ncbi:hypothetical protein [Halolamina salina]|uniref:Uncharacterized protein n=1 Tax=Halolamina salina TaxID=1220023 RepID=A0ABD6B8W3_9EURY